MKKIGDEKVYSYYEVGNLFPDEETFDRFICLWDGIISSYQDQEILSKDHKSFKEEEEKIQPWLKEFKDLQKKYKIPAIGFYTWYGNTWLIVE
jgi:hypothetical protein